MSFLLMLSAAAVRPAFAGLEAAHLCGSLVLAHITQVLHAVTPMLTGAGACRGVWEH